ncbi:sigma-70 family RNA polymerase sigma factor [Rhizobium leguminosarum]|nr:sigma-70 family RNA polymerase sigma factor [Rhizobium ruizarguesonis]TCA30181.1 RNA polymerase sigma factor [Rhizobium leguminosarum bv. viciae]
MGEEFYDRGRFDLRYKAFLEMVSADRARLHRYCARMTGSVLDGEDVMQEALFEAYRKLDHLQSEQSLGPWLHRLVHNRCIDFIRSRTVRRAKEAAAAEPDVAPATAIFGHDVSRALERLVIGLPPKERACVLLKDVFDYNLNEIAELVGSTPGGVKAALHRGREKLTAMPPKPANEIKTERGLLDLHALYVDRFNRQDWDGLRNLIHDDARLMITDVYAGRALRAYFVRFEEMPFQRDLVSGFLDNEPVLVLLGGVVREMVPSAVIRLEADVSGIALIRHYSNCPWIFALADSLELKPALITGRLH